MQKINSKLWVRFVPLLLVLTLTIAACGTNNDGPDDPDPDTNQAPTVVITPESYAASLPTGGSETGGMTGGSLSQEFTATGTDVDGDDLTYSWSADEGVDLSTASGETTTATFDTAGTFEISVEADDGEETGSDSVTATIGEPGEPVDPVDPVDPGDDATAPTGTFGVSTSQDGPFQTDDPFINDASDERIIDVAPGGTFYAQVDYSDPSGITDIELRLVNGSPSGLAGPLPAGGFSVVGDPTGDDCDLTGESEDIVCVYAISVAEGTEPITALEGSGSEFAYVFRARVTDGADNQADDRGTGSRGYVNITQ